MLHDNNQPSMEVDRVKLMKKLRENRKAHEAEHKKMCEGYQVLVDEANERFQKMLKEAFAKDEPHKVDHDRLYREAFKQVVQPEEHLYDYDKAIDMLTWIEEEKIRISLHQFSMWIRDEWPWKGRVGQILASTAFKSAEYRERFTR